MTMVRRPIERMHQFRVRREATRGYERYEIHDRSLRQTRSAARRLLSSRRALVAIEVNAHCDESGLTAPLTAMMHSDYRIEPGNGGTLRFWLVHMNSSAIADG
jgi:hypothetical protein